MGLWVWEILSKFAFRRARDGNGSLIWEAIFAVAESIKVKARKRLTLKSFFPLKIFGGKGQHNIT